MPTRLEIPRIGVNTAIENMGLTASGNLAVPGNIVDVGWYQYGARPGNIGTAVIDGHVDGPQGQAGVFSGLAKLQQGDRLSVTDDKNHVTAFVVQTTRIYGQNDQPKEVFSSDDGAAHLNLITCTGAWDTAHHRFMQRLVVFADKMN